MAAETFDELVTRHLELVDESPDLLADRTIQAEREIWLDIRSKLDELDTKDGLIQSTKKNVRLVGEITEQLRLALGRSSYVNAVGLFIQDFTKSTLLTDEIATRVETAFKPSEIQKDLLRISQNATIDLLVGDSAFNRLKQPFLQVLTSAIASRSSFKETVDALRVTVEGDKDTDGRLLANVKTVAATSLSVADATYSTQTAQSINAQWFKYVGRPIKTTRAFCEERANKYYHINEIKSWGNLEWNGQIEGTDSTNIFNYRGGWNCRHIIQFVSIRLVPESVIQRNIANGNYTP